MSFQDVLTLFHEFGHALQHMLTKETLMEVAGINGIEWDAVELPSQFMENWCYHPQTLSTISGHWETNEPLPKDMLNKILNARHHLSGTAMLRQLYFGRLDMDLHVQTAPAPASLLLLFCCFVCVSHAILQPLPEDRFLASFLHLFADTASPYAAGYFSYKWAEVMSADAFARFEEEGLEDNATVQRVGRQFKDTVSAGLS
ncbi:CYOP [Symbiodinium sp. KB8]|nr:CYOP [Symbiodinium sp. KB8]